MNFSVVGTGNIAFHFSKMLEKNGHHLVSFYGRNEEQVAHFRKLFPAAELKTPDRFSPFDGPIILAVPDHQIAAIDEQINPGLLCIHTSGSTALTVLRRVKRAVLWPLQTFTKGKELSFDKIPTVLDCDDEESKHVIKELFYATGFDLFEAKGPDRQAVHLAAVLACNFTNHLYAEAEDLLKSKGLDLSILFPLISETAIKIHRMAPDQAQTGPAVRHDSNTIDLHEKMLESDPELQLLYRKHSERIQKRKKNL
ncbi:MAG: hypothetical protein RLZZ77_1716 [Bacteroidota bacterium]